MPRLSTLDWFVLAAYFGVVLATGFFFWRKSRTADEFTAGGRTLPGWLCGLSIFATYVSSISYLALPGKAYASDWSALVFAFALPVAAWIAVRVFLPLYRSNNDISAYAMLERRFGLWARLAASLFYLLYQLARIGVVTYLMALPMAVLFGWDIRWIIAVTGAVVLAYSLFGGVLAVIWGDAIQAVILMGGAALTLLIIWMHLPGGVSDVWRVGWADGKFSLGSFDALNVGHETFWVILAYGLMENLKNFGVDQSYVQRYIAAADDREAARSVWLGALLYIPVSFLFFVIGTSLYVFYQNGNRADDVRLLVARQHAMRFEEAASSNLSEYASRLTDTQIGDRVLPHFIATQLPSGVRGLLIAAIFAAAMSTVSTSLNSSATLVMSDLYQRLIRPQATDAQLMRVLRLATLVWGVAGTAVAIGLVYWTESVLDIWWTLSGVLGATIVGLFLMGLVYPRLSDAQAKVAAAAGLVLIAWMTFSPLWAGRLPLPVSPFHKLWILVVGPVFMLAVAGVLRFVGGREADQNVRRIDATD